MGWSVAPGDATLESWQSKMFNQWLPPSAKEHWGRRTMRKISRGDDVASMGELADIRQLGATQGAGVDMNYMTGANKLLAENGSSEDVSQMNRQRDLAHQRVNQQTGINEVAGLTGLMHEAVGASDPTQRQALNLQSQSTALNNRDAYYQSRLKYTQPFWQQALLAGISGGAAVAGAAVGRPSSGPGG